MQSFLSCFSLLCVSAPLRLCVKSFAVHLLIALGLCSTALAADAIPPIRRVLPPEGLEIPAEVGSRLESRLAATKKRLDDVKDDTLKPDAEIFTKAVDLALIHREFYVEKDFAKADWALNEANKRLDLLAKGESPWTKATGTIVEGYRSSIDGSAQPYGLVIPENHDFSKPSPLYVWLHGRGDKSTDIHFLQERATRPGQITPPNAIVVHPFGRHCVGWKHAGEIDVLEVVQSVQRRYKIDPDRVVLIGFSMGGAGAWHLGAHYSSPWVAVSPGAGFVEVARYQKIPPDKYPPWYEQKLWGLYDVPDYVRNLFNTSVIAYSGELDKQREAAVIMEEAFKNEGHELTHLIGPGVEHKYESGTLAELLKRLEVIVAKGNEEFPSEVHLQTRTLQYPAQHGLIADRLTEHWLDSRIDALRSENKIELTTKNIAQFTMYMPGDTKITEFVIDGQSLQPIQGSLRQSFPPGREPQWMARFEMQQGRWGWMSRAATDDRMIKRPAVQGPIDNVFQRSFLVVVPTGKSRNPRFQAWVDFELAHFRDRWRALMRGELKMKNDVDVTEAELGSGPNLVLWGDPDSNSVMARVLEKSPVRFSGGKWTFGAAELDGDRFVPALIFPRQAGRLFSRYVVLNSGLTFREGHDRTNSLQNPKLPDWAIIDITQPPDALAPGRIHDADFFDENWRLKRQPKAPQ
jgi:pimeloyl-ACP methyl ester carboxylesterase